MTRKKRSSGFYLFWGGLILIVISFWTIGEPLNKTGWAFFWIGNFILMSETILEAIEKQKKQK